MYEKYISSEKPNYFYLATKQSIDELLEIDTPGFRVYHKKDKTGEINLIKWTAPSLTTIELPRELDEQIASHHWSKQLWDLFVELKCLPIMDYEYDNNFDVTDERKNFVFNVQKRKMLREDVDDNRFVLSSCCYTTFVIPNGVLEEQRIKNFFDDLIHHYIETEKEIEWSVPNNGEDGIDNIYQKLENDLAVYLKFRKTNDVSFERLEEYRCEILDGQLINRIIDEFNDIKIYRGKLFRVL